MSKQVNICLRSCARFGGAFLPTMGRLDTLVYYELLGHYTPPYHIHHSFLTIPHLPLKSYIMCN